MTNLHNLKRQHLLKLLKSTQWRVIIADKYSQQLILDTLKMNEILQQNITEIQELEDLRRQPSNYDKLYFVLPTSHSVKRVIKDVKQATTPCSVYFLDQLPKYLEQWIVDSGIITKLEALSELSINFNSVESRAFITDQPTAFNSFYSQPPNIPSSEVQVGFIVKGLLNILTLLNIFPSIRYQNPLNSVGTYANPVVAAGEYLGADPAGPPIKRSTWKSAFTSSERGSGVARRVAIALHKELQQMKRDNPDFGLSDSSSTNTAPPILLITDRTLDVCLPLIHDFQYQSLATDVLPDRVVDTTSHPPIYTFKSTAQAPVGDLGIKRHSLSDKTDSIWADIRHLHMKEAIDKVGELTREAEKIDSGFKESKGLDGLRSMLAGLSDLEEIKEKAFIHTNLSGLCMAEVSNRHLMEVSEVEQCCATGQTADGRTPRHLIEQMVPLLDLPHVTNKDKIRIIALYIIFKEGVSDEDKRRLYQHARLGPTEQEAIDNLVHLGIKLSKNDQNQQSFRKYKYRGKMSEDVYDTSRYVPALKTTVMELLQGRLDNGNFPKFENTLEGENPSNGAHEPPSTSLRTRPSARPLQKVTPAPSQGSLRSARATWATASRSSSSQVNESASKKVSMKEDNDDLKKQKVLVFVCGGMLYSEIRAMYELANSTGRDILVGSTDIFTPMKFVDNLRKLGGGYMYGSGSTLTNEANMKFSNASTALGKLDKYSFDPGRELSDKKAQQTAPDLTPEEVEARYYKKLQEAYDRKYWTEEIQPPPPPPPMNAKGEPIVPKPDKKDEKRLKKEQKEIEKHIQKQQEVEKKKEKKFGKKGWF